MNKEYFIQLTTSLYHLTLLFPKKEPLRYKIREVADEVLANLVLASMDNFSRFEDELFHKIEKYLAILDSFFELAIVQNWTNPSYILQVQKEYAKVQEELRIIPRLEQKLRQAGLGDYDSNSVSEKNPGKKTKEQDSRQEKIVKILKEKGRAQVWELKRIFPQVTKRTLRRDFEQLLKRGLVERIGERNNTFYKPVSR